MRALILAALIGAALSLPAYAGGPQCDSREALMQRVAECCAESIAVVAIGDDGSLIEITASGAGATWSMIVTPPKGGKSCLVASGKSWSPRDWLMPPVSPEFGEGV